MSGLPPDEPAGRARAARRRPALVLLLLAVTASLAVGLLAARGGGSGVPAPVRDAAMRFLTRYELPSGRVVRSDQGGDSVSEGQAYALLLSAAIGDRSRFAAAWSWTRAHLQRGDGTLAWRWAGPADDRRAGPAADADLDAARALAVAAVRFRAPRYAAAARRIARGVLAHETARVGGRLVLVAGAWARARGVIDPSYFAPRTYDILFALDRDPRWRELRSSSAALTDRLTATGSRLAPDWATASSGGVSATGAGGAGEALSGYDAARLPVRFAEACESSLRGLAARPWPLLHAEATARGGLVAAVHGLDGAVRSQGSHPVALVGAAAAAQAAGDRGASGRLLARADALERRAPSYYGAAWAALGRTLLTTSLVGGCAAPA
ncbi:MAG: glycoside hydrolase, family 8 [Conexibacter sp.]|nr:glycoside hydrolase, family 8 [Conexibacter sp.]